MKLKLFQIKGFRRILDSSFSIGDATFLIGENNIGKSAVLSALEIFHSGDTKLNILDFFYDEGSGFRTETVEMIAEYSGLPVESDQWKGFKGRVLRRTDKYNNIERFILFKKVYTQDGKSVHSLKEYNRTLKDEFAECITVSDFVEAGLEKLEIEEIFGAVEDKTKLNLKKFESDLEELTQIWDFDYEHSDWFERPGGIVGNITSKLPRVLIIPAEDRKNDIDGKSGALQKVMNSLFDDVRDSSENFKQAQEHLQKLSEELDPEDETKEFGAMMSEINSIVGNVFPETGLHVKTELDDADKVLKPHFNIEMSSNIRTTPERQGTGAVRAAAFALLRFREHFLEKKAMTDRNLIIGFEEPEIYLHPNAANNMRDEIYNLAVASTSQIICTTHSPFMIDLAKDIDEPQQPKQLLNLLRLIKSEEGIIHTSSSAFNTTLAYSSLVGNEKDQLKFLLKIDDYIARIFFVKNIIILEGDTEDIVFRETIKRLPLQKRKVVQSEYQIIKARGKATIISLVNYLKAMGFQPFVIHDKDNIAHAIKFNQPIADALGGEEHRLMLENCMEDVLGYEAPSSNKPFTAYKFIEENWSIQDGWEGVGKTWKELIEKVILTPLFEENGNNEDKPKAQTSRDPKF